MYFYEIFKDIAIPLLSGIIGGILTMLGVIKTIKYQKADSLRKEQLAIKPYLICVDSMSVPSLTGTILFTPRNAERTEGTLQASVYNSDNGLCVIDEIQSSKGIKYTPEFGDVMRKDSYAFFTIQIGSGENLKGFELTVHDVMGNKYTYEMRLSGATFTEIKCH